MTNHKSRYIPAHSLHDAADLLKEHEGKAALLAGGTDLVGALKDEIHAEPPAVLVGLKTLQSASDIRVESDGLRLGAMTTLSAIAGHPAIKERYPLLAQAAASVASPQIRNVATVGGNLCQEPRCWYYRNPGNTFDCLRKGGRWCDALFAENRYHSIYGSMNVSSAPCQRACPIHNGIPAYMEALRAGKLEEATEILLQTNPLAAITGRVCSHYCEEECNRNDFDEAVSIRAVERTLGDHALEHAADFYRQPLHLNAKSVGIVGAGPAGLTAAYFLRKQGYAVTVYDQMPQAGGMLTYSIPAYRLPKAVVQAQVRALEGMGIVFKLNVMVGNEGHTLDDLRSLHDSLFLATGLWQGRKLRIENSDLLDSGLDFLIQTQLGNAKPVGRRVLVIGGGSVAVDVAISARRSGAEHVAMACLESLDIMPALPEDLEQADEEAIEILPSWGPQRVLEQDGRLTGLEMVRCTSVFDENGRFNPSFNPDETCSIEADQVLVAIGQAAEIAYVPLELRTPRGLIAAGNNSTQTSLPGVFAGGDVTGGSAVVVQAMAQGNLAAREIGAYLEPPQSSENGKGLHKALRVNQEALHSSQGMRSPRVPFEQRTLQGEDIATQEPTEIQREAQRCANCGCVAVNASDLAGALTALDARIETNWRTIPAGEFFTAAENATTVLEPGELVHEIWIPEPESIEQQTYLKFRIRNAIDFPIVSLAFRTTLQAGKFHNARLVLNAVAPVPIELTEVERLLEGKLPGEELAMQAGRVAVSEAQPLAGNKAKVEIVKALIRKAIIGTR
jgi:NADPH-dependent glutamate synthase beta subunit-like oxidoreductase